MKQGPNPPEWVRSLRMSRDITMVALATRCAEQKPPLPHLETPSSDPIPRPERTTEWQPQRRLRPEEVALLVTMRETGSEINDLAEHFGIHRSTVIAHLNRQGVEGRRRQGRALSDERLHQAGEFYVAGHSLIETGDRFDVDRRYLRKALPAAGFELRRPGRQAASS